LPDITIPISRLEVFEYKNEEYFAIGLMDGTVVIQQGE